MGTPLKGFGLGLRPEHYQDFIHDKQPVDWLEILSDNYMVPGGKPLYFLDKIRSNYPMVMHGVAMNLGSTDPLDKVYLQSLKDLEKRVEPALISDHLCWTGVNGRRMHDLLPLPYTEEAVKHVSERILQAQDFLGRRLIIENLSTYIEAQAPLTEWAFVNAVLSEADCDILLDINNIYVSSRNHSFNPLDYLNAIPVERVKQIHLAGHSDMGNYCIDTHDAPVSDAVWTLYEQATQRFGIVPTMIERDGDIPALDVLVNELNMARKIAKRHEDNMNSNDPQGGRHESHVTF
ncbi:DUF692 domain-containing protein [Hydromonas duriensis]|uniref:UPF0276 protein DFR44_10719 n=1 Tax=Hydromonas duriensis TaxID=1527608 RepID=A0A4R6Y8R2_9BURK|nr:DUF692 domain-containing protein [Hydromonas duriensis]TDR31803.1 hypothetical protein DFR44_10719 [Hydromonas duriensis]